MTAPITGGERRRRLDADDDRPEDDDAEDEVLKAGVVRNSTSHLNHAGGPPARMISGPRGLCRGRRVEQLEAVNERNRHIQD